MKVTTFAFPVALFLAGLSVGVLWSPRGNSSQMSRDNHAVSDVQPRDKWDVAKIKELYGEETAEFARQFQDLTIRIKEYPIDAAASHDGRFVIRLFGNGETIASDLRYPIGDSVTQLARHYSFSCGKQTYSCDFVRSKENSKITEAQFRFKDATGDELCYVDSDGDGRWDRFNDYTEMPGTTYVREGLCWKRLTNDAPKSENESDGKGEE